MEGAKEGRNRGRPPGSSGLSWRAFFQQTTRPLFILSASRRIRFVNAAWEALTGQKAETVRGMVCSQRRHSTALAAALAPTPDALAGRPDRVRRPAPLGRAAARWWDIQFLPLPGPNGLYGWLGSIDVIGEVSSVIARKLPPFLADLRARHTERFAWDWLEGEDERLQLWSAQLRQAAAVNVPLWLVGPPGSGKRTVARIVHAQGPHRHSAFVAIDCLGLQPYLVESLLFAPGNIVETGHVGTLYLQSPQQLPRDLQVRLAELSQEPPAPLRWIVGAECPAADLVERGMLIPQLANALAVWQIELPPLSARWECLPRWLELWCGHPHLEGDRDVLEVLQACSWTGNVRQLRQVLEQAVLRAAGQPLRREHLPLALRLQAEHAPAVRQAEPWPPLNEVLLTVEKQMIRMALRLCQFNHAAAAERLGIPRQRLLRRMEALGLTAETLPDSQI